MKFSDPALPLYKYTVRIWIINLEAGKSIMGSGILCFQIPRWKNRKQILTLEALEPENMWHFCLTNYQMMHRTELRWLHSPPSPRRKSCSSRDESVLKSEGSGLKQRGDPDWAEASIWPQLQSEEMTIHQQPWLFNKGLLKAHAHNWVSSELLFEGHSVYFFSAEVCRGCVIEQVIHTRFLIFVLTNHGVALQMDTLL